MRTGRFVRRRAVRLDKLVILPPRQDSQTALAAAVRLQCRRSRIPLDQQARSIHET